MADRTLHLTVRTGRIQSSARFATYTPICWWESDGWPFPRVSTISRRMNVNRRTVERALRSLQEKSLIVRQPAITTGSGPAVRRFDLSGLVLALQELATEYRAYGHGEEVSNAGTPADSDHREKTPA